MRKIVIDRPGGYDRLNVREFPEPVPGKGEVLIDVRASGVNFADCCVRMGLYSSAKEFVGWPITPGFEVSGIVKAVGAGVQDFRIGQRVFAVTLFNDYSSALCLPENQVFPLPDSLSFEEGASLPAVFLTAYYALFELVHPHPNDTVLIHSAAGGVGGMLVQLAKRAGCRVAGVVGAPHKVAAVQALGADLVIDKSTASLWKEASLFAPKGYDAVFDANGVETLKESYRHLALGGKLVVYGFHTMFSKGRGTPNYLKMAWDYLRTPRFNPLDMTKDNRSVLAFNLSYLFDKMALLREGLEEMLRLSAAQELIIPPLTCFPLEKATEAHRALESGQTVGKIVLTGGEPCLH